MGDGFYPSFFFWIPLKVFRFIVHYRAIKRLIRLVVDYLSYLHFHLAVFFITLLASRTSV